WENGRFTFFTSSPFLGTRNMQALTGWNRFMDTCLREPTFRADYLDRLDHALRESFTVEKMHARIDAMERLIEPNAALDLKRWSKLDEPVTDLRPKVEELKRFIANRHRFLTREVALLKAGLPGKGVASPSPYLSQ
ncbi:MAG: CotH kinase family protein, partial [Verrucomicrobiae bacterium]|nr:CotH kinase family protein [Verrucomicrobiae bacterium]